MKAKIITNNREIYLKLNHLNLTNEVILRMTKPAQIEKIIANINQKERVLETEYYGDSIIIRKVGPINYNVFLNK